MTEYGRAVAGTRPERAHLGESRATLRAFALATLVAAAALLGSALAQGSAATSEATFPNGLVGTVAVTPDRGIVGSQATLEGSGFDPGAKLDLTWSAYDGSWKLSYEDGEYTGDYLGRQFDSRTVDLASVAVDADGAFKVPFTIPEGFGGNHDVYVRQGGVNVNKAGFLVLPHFTMSPESGPVGTDITITATGLDDLNNIAGWYSILYDNTDTGFITAMTTRGSAEAVIPAAGRVGSHILNLIRAPIGNPYVAYSTSPYSYLPAPQFTFRVTDGEPVLPAPVSEQNPQPTPGIPPSDGGPGLWMDPQAGSVGTPASLHGKNFPPNATVELSFTEQSGSRVTLGGFKAVTVPIATVTAGSDGTFSLPFPIPDALGGEHRVQADVDGDVVARTYFSVEPTALPLEPASGPVGTPIMLHVKGIGWTQTNNIFAIVIDNTFMGYACGFSSNGDVQVPITASWAPGWHFIDLYPSFYRNKDYSKVDEQPFLYRQATLTWRDHPNKMHFRYAFFVTGETAASTQAGN